MVDYYREDRENNNDFFYGQGSQDEERDVLEEPRSYFDQFEERDVLEEPQSYFDQFIELINSHEYESASSLKEVIISFIQVNGFGPIEVDGGDSEGDIIAKLILQSGLDYENVFESKTNCGSWETDDFCSLFGEDNIRSYLLQLNFPLCYIFDLSEFIELICSYEYESASDLKDTIISFMEGNGCNFEDNEDNIIAKFILESGLNYENFFESNTNCEEWGYDGFTILFGKDVAYYLIDELGFSSEFFLYNFSVPEFRKAGLKYDNFFNQTPYTLDVFTENGFKADDFAVLGFTLSEFVPEDYQQEFIIYEAEFSNFMNNLFQNNEFCRTVKIDRLIDIFSNYDCIPSDYMDPDRLREHYEEGDDFDSVDIRIDIADKMLYPVNMDDVNDEGSEEECFDKHSEEFVRELCRRIYKCGTLSNGNAPEEHYGDTLIIFDKDKLINHTTYTIGDSYLKFMNENKYFCNKAGEAPSLFKIISESPDCIEEEDINAMVEYVREKMKILRRINPSSKDAVKTLLTDVITLDENDGPVYIELQFHGVIGFDCIKEIKILGNVLDEEKENALQRLEIPFSKI